LSTLSQNNIVVNYVLNDDQVNKAKTAYDKLTDAEKKAVDETRKLNDQLKKTGQEGSESAKKVGNEMNNITSLAKSGAGLLAGFFAVGSLVAFKDRLIETTIKFEGYSKAIQFGSGSAENFAKNQQFLNDLIQKYGLGLASTTEAYKSFFNASTLAGQSQAETNRQFEAVTKAGTVLKLTTDQMQGAFLALGQMMSKGTVQAEELRGQLGERIPGAFSIMAKALNVNERQLNKMLEQGQVLSRDALPKFAAELEKTFGKDAEKNLNGMVNSQNRFNNSIDQLVLAIGTKLQPFLQGAYDLAAGIATQLAGIGQAAKKETTENIALKKTESDIAKKILDISIQQGVFIERKRAASELLLEIDTKIKKQQDISIDARISKDQIALKKSEEKLAILYAEEKLLTQIAGVEIKNLKAKEPLTDAELKALKAQYDARLGLLALEKQERELRGKLANDPNAGLTAELKFLEDKLALQEQFAAKGVKISQTEITITKEQQAIAKKDYEAALMQNYKDTTDNEDAKEKAKKASMDRTLEMTKDYAKFSKDISDKSTQDEINNIEKTARIRRDAEEARAKYEKKKDDERNDIIQASFDLAADTTNNLFNLQSQYAANDFARKQKQFDEEVRLADGNVQKLTEIEERRRAAEKEYREKEFRANQAQAIANVIFNTAPIIAQYLAKVVTAPLAIIAAGAATAQIGFILAQPVPEFAEGTKGKAFKGKAIVGEKGTELVTTLSGKQYYTPPTATLAQFDEPVHITPNHLLGLNDKYLSSQYFNTSSKTDSSGMQIVTKLEAIENGLKNMPVAAISLDEKGFMKKVRTPNRSTTILNNRFKN
jgi:tape measure domain-containing protein